MADRATLRLAATLLLIALRVTAVVNFPHPGSPTPTDQAQFTAYATDASWTALHLGEFVGTALFLGGELVLFFALNVSAGPPRWVGFFAAVSAGVALAMAGVVYAVDGVALKQAVDAWVNAPAAEQASRFASAEVIRWLETGTRSYQELTSGLALVLFGIVIAWTARITRPVGIVMGLTGLASIVMGWVAGAEGLNVAIRSALFELSGLATLVWTIWLLIVAWTRRSGGVPMYGPANAGDPPQGSLSRAS
jgi:hypothetical protein